MSTFWNKQMEGADHLAAESSGSKELLTFYVQLLRAQADIYDSLRNHKDWLPSGVLATHLEVLQSSMTGLLKTVAQHGPTSLGSEAEVLLATEPEYLMNYWRN